MIMLKAHREVAIMFDTSARLENG